MRRVVVIVLGLLICPTVGWAGDVGAAVRAGDWDRAEAAARTAADPVTARLVGYLRALTPGAASASTLLETLDADAGWPQQGVLARRYADALTRERDDRVVSALCQRREPGTVAALLRCAAAMAPGDDMARRAWAVGITDAPAEIAFLKRWGPAIGPGLQATRFERLAWSESAAPGGALARQAVRVEPAMRPMAEAWLALKREDAAAPKLVAAVFDAEQGEPGMVLDLARWYRRAHRDRDAARVWLERGAAAELAAPAKRRSAFWNERNALVRQLLRAGEDQLAYSVAALPGGVARGDAAFLAGWIALRRLDRPLDAVAHFKALAAESGAAISQGRAQYWLGRALLAAGEPEAAQAAYRGAAVWATTYYGQLAALASGEGAAGLVQRIRALEDPGWDEERAVTFTGSEMARAVVLLVEWGLKAQARPFLSALAQQQPDPAGHSIVARFATTLGLPDQAVAAARVAGRDGVMMPEAGWPDNVDIASGGVERALALGVIRQESSFDPEARSPSGALGLMQLMPATAAQVARSLGETMGKLTDAGANVRLGMAYLGSQLNRFGAIPPALAAYNAGPTRARDWVASLGDPAAGAIDPTDWVELIPFDETRNYVQRIVESVMIYRAREGVALPHPVLVWAVGSGI
ncbi:MAG: lytic transglycosylase domain-containing protein [Acetobacteraceae bacterium]|nr:lytic transglycosylase domain-containing protein [Acetobacteraceae bacterium]